MPRITYTLLDVFTDRPFGGNPLAVVADPPPLTTETMQAVARELTLSETTFVYPPADAANDYRVRIFTPAVEMPMAGHPTIGTAYVLAQRAGPGTPGSTTAYRFEEGVGPIEVTVEHDDTGPGIIRMHQPLPAFGETLEDVDAVAGLLGLDAACVADAGLPAQVVSTGVPYLFIPVRDLPAMAAIALRLDRYATVVKACGAFGAYVFTRDTERQTSHVHGRMFAPEAGVVEDPATGSAAGPLGAYCVRHGLVTGAPTATIVAEQGYEMGRPSELVIEIDHADGEISGVRVGGRCVVMGAGALDFPEPDNG